jgi:predicted O-methyltransferase YrrM
MNQRLQKLLLQCMPSLGVALKVHWTLVRNPNSYLQYTGWLESIRRGYPCKPDGSELPWMNYAVISFLEARLQKHFSLFEFGSGFSTIFYSRHVKKVISVEYDPAWFATIRQRAPQNASILLQDYDVDGLYCRTIVKTGQRFDVVIVDGRDRVNCVQQSISCLSADGVILLDDSQRSEYAPGIEYARARGFKALDFEGLKPTGPDMHRTTVLYRSENCLGL